MVDVIVCSQGVHKQVSNCKAIEGVQSDHSAVKVDFMIASIKYKAKAMLRGTANWQKMQQMTDIQKLSPQIMMTSSQLL